MSRTFIPLYPDIRSSVWRTHFRNNQLMLHDLLPCWVSFIPRLWPICPTDMRIRSFVASCFSSLPLDKVRHECVWTAIMSTLLLASCFDVTVNGPPVLCQGISVTACASSTLVVALSWISCMIRTCITYPSARPSARMLTTAYSAVVFFLACHDCHHAHEHHPRCLGRIHSCCALVHGARRAR